MPQSLASAAIGAREDTLSEPVAFAPGLSRICDTSNVSSMDLEDEWDGSDLIASQNKDETEEEENEDNDDMSSELSQEDDLQEELWEAIGEADSAFQGNFCHASILPHALNPCLSISAIMTQKLLLLVLHWHRSVMENAVVDKVVRDTWEIDPSKLSFGNTGWKDYVDKTLCAEPCRSLGITIGNNPPRMELYKLLLYETGSHTQKANGMFATAIILLPSFYTGGQVIVSHSSSTQTIDFSQESLQSTALLAWYTDVKHEIKPVASGYRLALSYNLIQDVPTGNGKYQEHDGNTVACVLDHQYSPANLKDGLKALKGSDRNKLTHIIPIAEELGFKVGLARLEHKISGYAEDDGYHRRSRGYGCYWDEDGDYDDGEDHEMGEIEETATSISGLVDMNGVALLSSGTITFGDDCVIPKDPFEDTAPDSQDYEGYMGNGAGSLDYWYRRTVLVLTIESKIDEILYSAEGVSYAIRKLKECASIIPTLDDRRWAECLITRDRSLNSQQTSTLFDYSFKWNDLKMLKKIVQNTSCTLATVGTDVLIKAWDFFHSKVYETLLARSVTLSERMNFIFALPLKASTAAKRKTVDEWCLKESNNILSSYSSPEGIPYVFQKLKESSAILLTLDVRLWAVYIVQSCGRSLNKDQLATLFTYAIKWKILKMWKLAALCPSCSLELAGKDQLLQACSIFSFDDLRVTYEGLISSSNLLGDRLNLIYKLLSKTRPSERDAVLVWLKKQSSRIWSSYNSAHVQDIPTMLDFIRWVGLIGFKAEVMPNIMKRKDNYAFWIAFVKALHNNQQTIVNQEIKRMTPAGSNPDVSRSSTIVVNNLIKECLQAAASQWDAIAKPQYNQYTSHFAMSLSTSGNTSKVDRILDIIDNAILIADMDICKHFFLEIIKGQGTMVSKFKELYIPLIPRLQKLLKEKCQDICASPFVDFMQLLIGLYLRDVLGQKGQFSAAHLRKIGCGCSECNELDAFLMDFRKTSTTFRFAQARHTHLERQLATACDLCTHETIKIGSPHSLCVTKRPAVIEASTWAHRQTMAKKFLASIGTDVVLAKFMGNRYDEVKFALDGVKQFGLAPPGPSQGRASPTTAQSSASNVTTLAGNNSSSLNPNLTRRGSAVDAVTQVIGQKRKMP